MKRLLILCVGLLAVLSLAACGGAEPAVPAAEPPTPIPTVDPAEVDPNDFTLVGQTGRPQFLNAYASW